MCGPDATLREHITQTFEFRIFSFCLHSPERPDKTFAVAAWLRGRLCLALKRNESSENDEQPGRNARRGGPSASGSRAHHDQPDHDWWRASASPLTEFCARLLTQGPARFVDANALNFGVWALGYCAEAVGFAPIAEAGALGSADSAARIFVDVLRGFCGLPLAPVDEARGSTGGPRVGLAGGTTSGEEGPSSSLRVAGGVDEDPPRQSGDEWLSSSSDSSEIRFYSKSDKAWALTCALSAAGTVENLRDRPWLFDEVVGMIMRTRNLLGDAEGSVSSSPRPPGEIVEAVASDGGAPPQHSNDAGVGAVVERVLSAVERGDFRAWAGAAVWEAFARRSRFLREGGIVRNLPSSLTEAIRQTPEEIDRILAGLLVARGLGAGDGLEALSEDDAGLVLELMR